jgi:hypothetical protein
MRRPISSFNQGDVACGHAAQRALATGSSEGGVSGEEGSDMAPIIDTTSFANIALRFNPIQRNVF